MTKSKGREDYEVEGDQLVEVIELPVTPYRYGERSPWDLIKPPGWRRSISITQALRDGVLISTTDINRFKAGPKWPDQPNTKES